MLRRYIGTSMAEHNTLGAGGKAITAIMRAAVIERDCSLCYHPARYAHAT